MREIDDVVDAADRAYEEASAMVQESQDARARRRKAVLDAVRQQDAERRKQRQGLGKGWMAAAAVAGLSLVVTLVMRVEKEQGGIGEDGASVSVASAPPAAAVQDAPRANQYENRGAATSAADAAARQRAPAAAAAGQSRAQSTARAEQDLPERDAQPPAAAVTQGPAVAEALGGAETARAGSEKAADAAASNQAKAARSSRHSEAAALAPGAEQRGIGSKVAAPLVDAARGGNEGLVRSLLDAGANPEDRDGEGDTALLKAVRQGHYEVAGLLLRRGADRGARGRDGQSSEGLAASSDDERMRMLFSR